MEELAVDPAGEQVEAFETAPLQFHALAAAGHQGHLRAVVEPAQVAGDQPGQRAEAVVLAVLLEVGVETADRRDAQAPRGAQGGEAERAFGGDVEHVRALALPAAQQLVQARHAPLQAGVAGQRPAAGQHQLGVAAPAVVAGLARAHHLNPMAKLLETGMQATQGIGDAVDFRWVGFADQGDA